MKQSLIVSFFTAIVVATLSLSGLAKLPTFTDEPAGNASLPVDFGTAKSKVSADPETVGFLAKYKADGSLLWANLFGGSNFEHLDPGQADGGQKDNVQGGTAR